MSFISRNALRTRSQLYILTSRFSTTSTRHVENELLAKLIEAELDNKRTSNEDLIAVAKTLSQQSEKPDILTLTNFHLLSRKLKPRFKRISERYLNCYKPLFTHLDASSYQTRLSLLLRFLEEFEEFDASESDTMKTLSHLRPDIVDTIKLALQWGDEKHAFMLLRYYEAFSDKLPAEEWHSLKHEALENGCVTILLYLLKDKKNAELITARERELAVQLLVRQGEVETVAKLWNHQSNDSFSASLIVELLGSGSVNQCIQLMQFLKPTLKGEYNTGDFSFIVELIKLRLKELSSQLTPTQFGRTDGVRRPAMKEIVKEFGDIFHSSAIDNSLKSMLATLTLTAISELSNTTGVVFLYMLLPTEIIDSKCFEVMFNACQRGNDGCMRALELFKFAKSRDVEITEKAYTFLIKTSSLNVEELQFYLAHYTTDYPTTSPMMEHRLRRILKIKKAPKDSKELISTHLRSPTPLTVPPNLTLTKFNSYYDQRESEMLKRHHATSKHPKPVHTS